MIIVATVCFNGYLDGNNLLQCAASSLVLTERHIPQHTCHRRWHLGLLRDAFDYSAHWHSPIFPLNKAELHVSSLALRVMDHHCTAEALGLRVMNALYAQSQKSLKCWRSSWLDWRTSKEEGTWGGREGVVWVSLGASTLCICGGQNGKSRLEKKHPFIDFNLKLIKKNIIIVSTI